MQKALGLSEVLQLLGMIASTLASRHHRFHFSLTAPQKKSLSEFTTCGNVWIQEMKADAVWAGAMGAGAVSLPRHLDPALPSPEPGTLLSTSTSQKLAW